MSSLLAENWPSWRGPSHNGSRAGENYPTKWSADKVAWKVALPGKGASSPVVWKDRIFLTAPAGGVDTALAFDLDGNQIWKTEFGTETKAKHMKLGTSSNASPVNDGKGVSVSSPIEYEGKIYLLRHNGEIVCLDPKSGKPFWTAKLPKSIIPYYASPVIAGGILYAPREDGVVFSARIGEKFDILGDNKMGEQILATPVPFDGKLLIRTSGHLICVR